ncbi:MAG: OmpH family outer membrane protein [Bradymonadia bacterium]
MRNLTLICGFLALTSSFAVAKTKIAYVDMQRAILEADDGKKAKQQLKKMKDARQSELDQKQKAVRALQEGYEAQKAFMTEDVKKQKEQELGQKIQELKMTFATLQRELAAEEAKLTKPILERMAKILSRIGEKSGNLVILEKNESRVLWAPKKLDLTDELIRRYDQGEGKAKGKKGKKGKK